MLIRKISLVSLEKISACILLFLLITLLFNLKHKSHFKSKNEMHKEDYSYESLPKFDHARLLNMNNFHFIITNNVCDKPLDLLVAVYSPLDNIEMRNAIRETWGSKIKNVKVLFLLGTVNDQNQQDVLDDENNRHRDILQGNFIDHFRNKSYKLIMALKYTIYFCSNVKYLLKTDDKIFVNMPVLIDYIKSLNLEKDLMLCSVVERFPWNVGNYKNCYGFIILFTYDVGFRLYREAQNCSCLDDILFTGKLAKRLNVAYAYNSNLFMRQDESIEFMKSNGTKGKKLFIFGPKLLGVKELKNMWIAVINKYSKISSYWK